jgi:hypothetical protein
VDALGDETIAAEWYEAIIKLTLPLAPLEQQPLKYVPEETRSDPNSLSGEEPSNRKSKKTSGASPGAKLGKSVDPAPTPASSFKLPYEYVMVMFDCLEHFHVFPDGGRLLDQSPLVWHDLKMCFVQLAQAMGEEDDHESLALVLHRLDKRWKEKVLETADTINKQVGVAVQIGHELTDGKVNTPAVPAHDYGDSPTGGQ